MEHSIDDNAKYLDNGHFYLGFGKSHSEEILTHLNNGVEQFSVNHSDRFHGKEIDYRIDHKRSAESGWTSMSGFLLTPREKPEMQQYFGVYKNRGFTAKEAFNLVEGRAVCKDHWKDQVKYQSWHVMNFENKNARGNAKIDSYHENYGFDVAKALQNLNWSKTDGKSMPPWAEENLRKGDPLRATVEIEGADVEANIIANPKTREVLGIDDEGKVLARAEGISEAYLQKKEVQPQTDLHTRQEVNHPAGEMSQDREQAATIQGMPTASDADNKQAEEQLAAQAAEYFSTNAGEDGLDPFLQDLARDLGSDVSEINDIPFIPDDPAALSQQAMEDAKGTEQDSAGKEITGGDPALEVSSEKSSTIKQDEDKKKVTSGKTSGKAKEKIERIPPRQHAPMNDLGPSKGKKR